MGKKLSYTPRSQVRAALRLLWLRSRERNAAVKAASSTCQGCGRKASTAKGREFKVEVHHIEGVCDWEAMIDYVYKHLLCDSEKLEVLCKECHESKHNFISGSNDK